MFVVFIRYLEKFFLRIEVFKFKFVLGLFRFVKYKLLVFVFNVFVLVVLGMDLIVYFFYRFLGEVEVVF